MKGVTDQFVDFYLLNATLSFLLKFKGSNMMLAFKPNVSNGSFHRWLYLNLLSGFISITFLKYILVSFLFSVYLYLALQCQGGNDLWWLVHLYICSLGNIFSWRVHLLNMVPGTSQATRDIIITWTLSPSTARIMWHSTLWCVCRKKSWESFPNLVLMEAFLRVP